MPHPKTIAYKKKVNLSVEQLLTRYSGFFDLLSSSDKTQDKILTETLQIEYNASAIIKEIEDLLTVTRSMKETWILGQVQADSSIDDFAEGSPAQSDKNKQLAELLDKLIAEISKTED